MLLHSMTIKNFRGIKDLYIDFEKLTVIIGENNTGKSTILNAINSILTKEFYNRSDLSFKEYDFHLTNDLSSPYHSGQITIDMDFSEINRGELSSIDLRDLNDFVVVDSSTRLRHIYLRAEGRYDKDLNSFETSISFFNNKNELLHNIDYLHDFFIKFIPVFFLSALRNAVDEFSIKGEFWSSFLDKFDISDDESLNIENQLKQINDLIINSYKDLREVIGKIDYLEKIISLEAKPVIVEALPTKVFELSLRRT